VGCSVSFSLCVVQPLSRDKLVQLLVRYGVENSCSKLC
jgi:hypothetical protein